MQLSQTLLGINSWGSLNLENLDTNYIKVKEYENGHICLLPRAVPFFKVVVILTNQLITSYCPFNESVAPL